MRQRKRSRNQSNLTTKVYTIKDVVPAAERAHSRVKGKQTRCWFSNWMAGQFVDEQEKIGSQVGRGDRMRRNPIVRYGS